MKKIIIYLFLLAAFILNFNFVYAQQQTANNTGSSKTTQNNSNSGSCSGTTCTLNNPLGSISTPQALVGQVINTVLGVVGSLALLMFIYGGLTWMTSSGNEEKVKKGRDIILWSAIGLVVIFLSYALTRFVLGAIAQ